MKPKFMIFFSIWFFLELIFLSCAYHWIPSSVYRVLGIITVVAFLFCSFLYGKGDDNADIIFPGLILLSLVCLTLLIYLIFWFFNKGVKSFLDYI